MKYPRYKYSTENQLFFFEFESIGIKGKIKKMVQYSEMSVKGFYNLGFGNFNEKTSELEKITSRKMKTYKENALSKINTEFRKVFQNYRLR